MHIEYLLSNKTIFSIREFQQKRKGTEQPEEDSQAKDRERTVEQIIKKWEQEEVREKYQNSAIIVTFPNEAISCQVVWCQGERMGIRTV